MAAYLDCCDVSCIHRDVVEEVRRQMVEATVAQSLAGLFKILGDPTRVKILFALLMRELCVCDIAAVIGASESAVSHQLRLLRNHKLVKNRREGKVLYYSLADDHVEILFSQGLDHVAHS